MKSNRTKVITIAALIIAVIALSIGFAAFSSTLNIQSRANVNPDSKNFKVVFSTNSQRLVTNPVVPNNTTLGDNATIFNAEGNPKLDGLKARFTSPGQSVTYNLYVLNTGLYDAYLTNLDFEIVSDNKFIQCISKEDTTDSITQQACSYIYVTVQIGSDTFVSNSLSGLKNEISNHKLEIGKSEPVTVTINYPSEATYVDGPMEVKFGSVNLQYRTIDNTASIADQQVDYTKYFVSYEQGVLSEYIGTETSVVIPDGLSLPLLTATGASFNMDKCLAMFDGDESGLTICKSIESDIKNGNGSCNEAICDITYESTNQEYLVTEIGDIAFQNKNLESIKISNNIRVIGTTSFNKNNLTQVIIPSTVEEIRGPAFAANPLTTVIIGDSVNRSNIRNINMYAFNPNGTIAPNTYPDLQKVEIYADKGSVNVSDTAFGNYDITNSWK